MNNRRIAIKFAKTAALQAATLTLGYGSASLSYSFFSRMNRSTTDFDDKICQTMTLVLQMSLLATCYASIKTKISQRNYFFDYIVGFLSAWTGFVNYLYDAALLEDEIDSRWLIIEELFAYFLAIFNFCSLAEFDDSGEFFNQTQVAVILGDDEEAAQGKRRPFSERLGHFSGDIPDYFVDYATTDIMNNPYILNTGHSVDRITAVNIVEKGNRKCPVTRQPITFAMPNINLKRAIEDFVSSVEAKPSSADSKAQKR